MNAPPQEILYIFGAGGAGRELAWLARQSLGQQVHIRHLVDSPHHLLTEVAGNSVGLLDDLPPGDASPFVVALGDPRLRERFALACEQQGLRPATLLDNRLQLSSSAHVSEGSVVCAGSVLTVDVRIGRHVYVNVGCTISHDVDIGDYSTLSPGVRVCGNVSIGRAVFIGAGATIINGTPGQPLVVGEGAVVAAGACVIGPVEPFSVVAGVPARRIR